MLSDGYIEKGRAIGLIVGTIVFLVAWIYCIAAYGFMLGVGLGWLPSLIVAFIAYFVTAFVWGPVAFVLALAVAWLLWVWSPPIVVTIVLIVFVTVVGGILFEFFKKRPLQPQPGDPDYYDWANRRGKYADPDKNDK